MKFNLKNRPEKYINPIVERWFDGFEKGLHERQNELDRIIKEITKEQKDAFRKMTAEAGLTYQYGFWCYLRGLRNRGQEILGE